MNWIDEIQECFRADSIFYTRHAKIEMENEEFGRIFEHEISEVVRKGEIIEEYPDDKPYPSFLIYGKTDSDRPIHIVCSYNAAENLSIIITVYQPNPELWIDYKGRKEL